MLNTSWLLVTNQFQGALEIVKEDDVTLGNLERLADTY